MPTRRVTAKRCDRPDQHGHGSSSPPCREPENLRASNTGASVESRSIRGGTAELQGREGQDGKQDHHRKNVHGLSLLAAGLDRLTGTPFECRSSRLLAS